MRWRRSTSAAYVDAEAVDRVVCGNARSARGVDDAAGSGSDKPERTARSCDLENTAPGWRRRILWT